MTIMVQYTKSDRKIAHNDQPHNEDNHMNSTQMKALAILVGYGLSSCVFAISIDSLAVQFSFLAVVGLMAGFITSVGMVVMLLNLLENKYSPKPHNVINNVSTDNHSNSVHNLGGYQPTTHILNHKNPPKSD